MTADSGTLEVKENLVSDFAIYPDPVKDFLNISASDSDIDYRLFSIDGKKPIENAKSKN